MKAHLSDKGFVVGLFSDEKLAAFRNVYYPEIGEHNWNLGMDIGLCNEELADVANLQMVCVHPDYRGNGLALKMNRISLRLLSEHGTYEHICATVSPYNFWNIRILLDSGFHIRSLKRKYGGKLRYIVYQRLRNPVVFDGCTAIKSSLNDFYTQKKLLADGYCGLAVTSKGTRGQNRDPLKMNQWNLIFMRPKSICEARYCA